MTKKLPKLRIHISLPQILLGILAVVVAFEGYILYRAFYAEAVLPESVVLTAPKRPVAIRLDMAEYEKIKEWIEKNREYELSGYNFVTASGTSSTTIEIIGRENPFAE